MQFRKLRLVGFKSFVEPAELIIEPGLTGVVGPNGCGKSNLLEAIRWVMGENAPKSMRSGSMEEVIFAGTSTRPPRDFAEVMLLVQDEKGEELAITRRIERGAGSAYRINGRDVRARDVALLFADAATGAHSPALVSQGRIAQVIAARPAERRLMLEEAAGIAGLHVRRREAEGRLRQTEANLARLADLVAGLDGRIVALARQARQAERYRMLSSQIQLAEARLLFARWRDADAAAEAARAEAEAAGRAVAEAQMRVEAAQHEQAALAARLATARDELADRRDDARAHGHHMATLASQLEAAEARLADLDRQQQRLEEDRRDADRLTRDAARALADLEAALAASSAELAAEAAHRPMLERRRDEAEAAARAAELELARTTAHHAGIEAEWRVAEGALAQARAALARLEAEQRRLETQAAALGDAAAMREAAARARRSANEASAVLAAAQARLAEAQLAKEKLAAASDAASAELAATRADLAGVEREWAALARDREARAKAQANRRSRASAIDQVAAEPGYERALAAALGRDAAALIGPAGEAEGRFWTGAPSPPTVPDSLLAHVRQCPPELAARLALVHVVNQDDGRALAPGHWLVTRDGVLRRWDGLVARGGGAAEAARLEADNRFAALDARMPELRAALAAAQDRHGTLAAELSATRRQLVALERAVNEAASAERVALRQADQAEAEVERLAHRRAELDEARHELAARKREVEAELAAANAARAALPDPAAARARLEAARHHTDTAREAARSAMAALSAHEQALASARERVAAQRADIRSWQARASEAERRLAGMEARFAEIAEERAMIAARPAALRREIEAGEVISARLGEQLAAAQAGLARAESQARAGEAQLAEAAEALASAREARATAVARASHEEQRRSELGRQCGERFACPAPLLPERAGFDPATIAPAASEQEALDRLLASRERLGPVNLVAAEELAQLQAEREGSGAEQAELAEAVARLRGTIGSLNREGRERLRAAFAAVDGHFRMLFTRLFEGGQAHLALVDAEDPLEAGLEIYAQPPGKRLQSLSLLSGGEQALTATALIFALFLTNPAPICVLDEVDAPLDDANIERFCDLLDHMVAATATRYLIVTHNAVTMSRMHRLFGVTMVERGVSRLVSVDLGAAERLAAEREEPLSASPAR